MARSTRLPWFMLSLKSSSAVGEKVQTKAIAEQSQATYIAEGNRNKTKFQP